MSKLVRKGRWVGQPRAQTRRMFADDVHAPDVSDEAATTYAEWLVAQLGRPMERAMIRASLRYEQAKRRRRAINVLRIAYRRKKR